jgi:hypothetical protein
MENNNKQSPDTKTPRHVLAAQKAQRVLAEMQAAKLRRRIEENEQIEAAKQSAATELARARHLERMKFKKREYRMATALGKLVLISLRKNGISGILLDAQSIESQWPKEDFLDLKVFLQSSPLAFCDTIGVDAENGSKNPNLDDESGSDPNSGEDFSSGGEMH